MGVKRIMPSPAMAVALTALVVAATGAAVAAIPGPDGTITVCYANNDLIKQLANPINNLTEIATPTGAMRVVQDGAACASGESQLTFNQRGQTGPPGPTGPAGPSGPLRQINGTQVSVTGGTQTIQIVNNLLPGRDLVLATVQYSSTDTSGNSRPGDLRCWIPTGSGGRFATAMTQWSAGSPFVGGTLAMNAVITFQPKTSLLIKCSHTPVPGAPPVIVKSRFVFLQVGS